MGNDAYAASEYIGYVQTQHARWNNQQIALNIPPTKQTAIFPKYDECPLTIMNWYAWVGSMLAAVTLGLELGIWISSARDARTLRISSSFFASCSLRFSICNHKARDMINAPSPQLRKWLLDSRFKTDECTIGCRVACIIGWQNWTIWRFVCIVWRPVVETNKLEILWNSSPIRSTHLNLGMRASGDFDNNKSPCPES